MKLEGTLDTFPLRELIEMTVYSSVTGVLTVYREGAMGRIFFRDGVPYHATFGDELGEMAVVRLFEERSGNFSFVADLTSDESTLWYDAFDLVELCERRARRWVQVRPEVPDMRLVPQLLNAPDSTHISFETDHWPVFSAIDGARSADEIVTLLGADPLEVCEALAALQRAGLLRLAPAASIVRQSAAAPITDKPHTKLFDRLLATLPDPITSSAQPGSAPPTEEDPILRILRS